MKRIVLSFPGHKPLAEAVAAKLDAALGAWELRQFPDGEDFVRVDADVRDCEVWLVLSLDRPNEKSVELYLLAATLRDLGARRVALVCPYLAYMRQDARFHPGEGITSRYFAQWLSSFLDGLVTVDPHLHRYGSLSEIYSIPTAVVQSAPAIARWVRSQVQNPVLIGPDSESEQWVSSVARGADCPFMVLSKTRTGDRQVSVTLPDPAALAGRTPVLVDDIASTARTMIAAVRHLLEIPSAPPVCVAVHGLFAGDAYGALWAAGAARIVSCNTVLHPSNAIDLNELIAGEAAALASQLDAAGQ